MAARLGIDLGTSNTVAVLATPAGTVPLLFDGSPLLPSGVYASQVTGLVVGPDAAHLAQADPAGYEPHPKRCVDEETVLLGRAEVPVTSIVAAVLGRVWAQARAVAGAPIASVTLTHPAAWAARRRGVLAAAAVEAGLGEVQLVPEPVAAAWCLVEVLGRPVPVGGVVAVYDLGAGTFDATVLRRGASGYEVLATVGLPDAGGLDIDAAIVAYLEPPTERGTPGCGPG